MYRSVKIFGCLVFLAAACLLNAQVAEQNVNMVSGTKWPGGDPFLQRQNEGSIAASTRNPVHLLAAANDYRTVDLPGLPDGEETGDAWIGVFKSFDAGQTWRSTLVPGYPQDQTSLGLSSPLKGFDAGADPVVRAGANGMFYLTGIVLDRDPVNPLGALFISRFIDNNNLEAGDPIAFLGTAVIDKGTSGQFVDKPWTAVAPAPAGSTPCTVNGQTFAAQNVFIAYTIFTPNDAKYRSKLMFARSGDCGSTWNIQKLSETYAINQGATVAVDPTGNNVYVAWRQFASSAGDPNAIVVATSTNQGKNFSKGTIVTTIDPFEQGTTSVSMRTNAYPTMAVDGNGVVYLAWAQRNIGPGGDARIVMMTSTDAVRWSQPVQVDPNLGNDCDDTVTTCTTPNHGRGHQFQPTLIYAAGKLMLVYYDLREDHTVGIFTRTDDGIYAEIGRRAARDKDGNVEDPEEGKTFTPNLMDAAPTGYTPLKRRHTVDVRAAESAGGAMPVFKSARVSRYIFGSRPGSGQRPIEQLQFNPPNFPMFRQGTVPFFGDYLDVTGYAASAGTAPVFHAVWTDNRDVRPPADGNWTHYTPPASAAIGLTSTFDPTKTVPQCVPGQTGMRNQNIYTARITEGLFAAAPANSKPLTIPRAFVVFVQNTKTTASSFVLSVPSPPSTPSAWFVTPAGPAQSVCLPVPARSGASRTVYVSAFPSNPRASVKVDVAEISGNCTAPGTLTGLATSVVLNPDVSNPDVSNPDVSNPDVSNPDVSNAEVHNPDVSNPDVSNPDVSNPDVSNPDVSNPDVSNPDVSNPDVSNPDVSNPDVSNPDVSNPDVSNPDVSNPDVSNGSVTDTTWIVKNQGNTTSSYTVKMATSVPLPKGVKAQLIINRLYRTPVARADCTLGEQVSRQVVTNLPYYQNQIAPDFSGITNIDPRDATLWLSPNDTARVTLRLFNGTGLPYDPKSAITPVIIAQADNTNGLPTPTTLTITTTSLPDGIAGRPYAATVAVLGGVGARSFSISGVPGLSIDANGNLSGVPVSASDGVLNVTVVDSAQKPHFATRSIPLHIAAPLVVTTSTLPEALTGQAYTAFAITASGGTRAKSWSLVSGLLPPGFTFSAGTISGTTSATGDYAFVVKVTDSGSPAQTATAQFTLRVIQQLAVSTTSLPDGVTGKVYNTSLIASGGYGSRSWTASAAMPAGLTLSPAGAIAGTATASGTFPITFTVTDSDSPANHIDLPLTIRIADPLVVSNAPLTLPEGTPGQSYSATLTTAGGIGDKSWQVTGGALPNGLSLATTGTISGTPTSTGQSDFTVTVTDSGSPSQSASRDLLIRVINPLATQTTSLPDGVKGTAYSATLKATGGWGTLSWSAPALPAGLTLAADGTISGTAPVSGTFPITFTVTDSDTPTHSVNLTLPIRIADALVVTSTKLAEATTGQPYSATLTTSGGTGSVTFAAGSALPPGLSLSNGAISGTPSSAGDSTFSITATDSASPAQSTTATISIRVADALVMQTTALSDGTAGVPYTATLLASGGYGTRTWSSSALPGTLTLSAAGVLSGSASTGSYPITFTVTDSDVPAHSVIRPMTLVIRDVLVITTSSLPVEVAGTTVTATLQASGGLAPYTWTATTPTGVTFNTSTATLTASVATIGTYTITATVTDSQGRVATKTFNLYVVAPLAITTTDLPDGTVTWPYSVTLQSTGGYSNITWAVTNGTLPAGLTLNVATGAITGTPTAVTEGAVTFTASDSAVPPNTVSATFLMRIHPAPGSMVIRPPAAAAGMGQLVVIDGANFPAATSLAVSFRDGTKASNGTIIASAATSTRLFVRLPYVGDGTTTKNLATGLVSFTVTSGKTTLGSGSLTVTTKPGTPILTAAYALTTSPSTDNKCGAGISNAPTQTVANGRGLVAMAFGVDVANAELAWTQGTNTTVTPSGCAFADTKVGVAPVFVVPAGLQSGAVNVQIRTTVNGIVSDWSAPVTLRVQ